MAQVKASSSRHKRGSTLTEMFKLAGDLVGDGMHMVIGKKPDFEPNQWDDDSSDGTGTTGQGGGAMRELRQEVRRSEDDDDDYHGYKSQPGY